MASHQVIRSKMAGLIGRKVLLAWKRYLLTQVFKTVDDENACICFLGSYVSVSVILELIPLKKLCAQRKPSKSHSVF